MWYARGNNTDDGVCRRRRRFGFFARPIVSSIRHRIGFRTLIDWDVTLARRVVLRDVSRRRRAVMFSRVLRVLRDWLRVGSKGAGVWVCGCVCVLAVRKIGVWVQGENVSPRHTSPPLQPSSSSSSSSVQSQFVRLEWLTSACACVRVYVSNRLATSFSVTPQTGNTRTRRIIRIFSRLCIRLYIYFFLLSYLISFIRLRSDHHPVPAHTSI